MSQGHGGLFIHVRVFLECFGPLFETLEQNFLGVVVGLTCQSSQTFMIGTHYDYFRFGPTRDVWIRKSKPPNIPRLTIEDLLVIRMMRSVQIMTSVIWNPSLRVAFDPISIASTISMIGIHAKHEQRVQAFGTKFEEVFIHLSNLS